MRLVLFRQRLYQVALSGSKLDVTGAEAYESLYSYAIFRPSSTANQEALVLNDDEAQLRCFGFNGEFQIMLNRLKALLSCTLNEVDPTTGTRSLQDDVRRFRIVRSINSVARS